MRSGCRSTIQSGVSQFFRSVGANGRSVRTVGAIQAFGRGLWSYYSSTCHYGRNGDDPGPCVSSGVEYKNKYMINILIPLSISSQRASCDPAAASPPFASTIEALELVRSLLWLFLLEANEFDV